MAGYTTIRLADAKTLPQADKLLLLRKGQVLQNRVVILERDTIGFDGQEPGAVWWWFGDDVSSVPIEDGDQWIYLTDVEKVLAEAEKENSALEMFKELLPSFALWVYSQSRIEAEQGKLFSEGKCPSEIATFLKGGLLDQLNAKTMFRYKSAADAAHAWVRAVMCCTSEMPWDPLLDALKSAGYDVAPCRCEKCLALDAKASHRPYPIPQVLLDAACEAEEQVPLDELEANADRGGEKQG